MTAIDVLEAAARAGLRLVVRGDVINARGNPRSLTPELREAIVEHAHELLRLLAMQQVLPGIARVPPDNDQQSKRPTPLHVGEPIVTRPKRARPERIYLPPALGLERVCCGCGVRRSPDGPVPYSWDTHVLEGRMLATCSPWCRADLGLHERKPAIDLHYHPVRNDCDQQRPNDGGKDAS